MKHDLDQILEHVLQEGPRVVTSLGVQLFLDEAETLTRKLKEHYVDVQPFDFPTTKRVWKSKDESGMPYSCTAVKMLLQSVANVLGVDYTSFEGFKKVIHNITKEEFFHKPINKWGTTIGGVFTGTYGGSPAVAVLDLIAHDQEFAAFSDLRAYDWPSKMPKGVLSKTMIDEMTRLYLQKVAETQGADYRTLEGFKKILPHLNRDQACETSINRWGTTMMSVFATNSFSETILAHIQQFPELRVVRPYDFNTPQSLWRKQNQPTDTARNATHELIKTLANELRVDYHTFEGFKAILPKLVHETFAKKPINQFGTTLGGMIAVTYGDSPSAAVLDLVKHCPEFSEVADLEPHDFPTAPSQYWNKNGKATPEARKAMSLFLQSLGREHGANVYAVQGFRKILPFIRQTELYSRPINRWGTTLVGMISHAYGGSYPAALTDLCKKDDDFEQLRPVMRAELFRSRLEDRQSRMDGKYSKLILIDYVTSQGIDLSKFGFFAFKGGEKREVRELFAEHAQSHLGKKNITYFGLEGPTFGSYFTLAQKLDINAKQSLVPERDARSYNVMKNLISMRKVNKLLGKSTLSGIELVCATAEEALKKTKKQFDLVFLDWLGFLSPSGLRELDLAYEHLKNPGMIGVTLNISPFAEKRYHRMTDSTQTQEQHMHSWAKQHGMKIDSIDYKGGDTRNIPMQLYILKK